MSVVSRRLTWLAALVLVAPLIATSVPARSPATAATTFVVDTVSDLWSLDNCTAALGDCSLRGAISAANASPGADTIHFDIPSGDCPAGACRISLGVGGIEITEEVDIDATTQPQHGSPRANVCATTTEPSHMRIEMVMDAGPNGDVFRINHDAGATSVRGFAFGTDRPNTGFGVVVLDGNGHHISCNHLILNGAGTGSLGIGSFAAGVAISGSASSVTIGTDGDGLNDVGERNVFGTGTTSVISVYSAINNTIAGNYFGFTADGSARFGAGSLFIFENAEGTLVGTNEDGVSDDLERNYFSGQRNLMIGSGPFDVDDVRIVGNTFGMSPTGAAAVSFLGIQVDGVPVSTTGFEIRNNTFAHVETGIMLDTSGSVLISGNTFGGDDNGTPFGSFVGIRAGRTGSYVIRDNLILNTQSAGVLVENTAVLAAGSTDNCLLGNTLAVSNTTGAEVVFEHNWWGDITGPAGAGSGSGDPVGSLVDFEPWLTAPPQQCNSAPVAADANFTLAEDVAAGTVVGSVSATDDGTTLDFAIATGNTGGAFAIDSTSGQLSVAGSLDYETTPAYLLTVEVSDPFLSDTASVAVVVTDVDEPAPQPTFQDVPPTHTFYSDVEWLAATGITRGCNPPVNDMYCPDASVTRGQMAAFLHRALDDTLVPGTPVEFVDDDDSVFEADIEWLGAVGVTRGCNPPVNDRFCPEQSVTRGQMAAFLVRALDLPAGIGVDFVDDEGSVFEDDIERLAAAGITRGCNPPANDRFCPDDAVTRAQMAAFLHRALTMSP